MSHSAQPVAVPRLLVVAAEDLFSNEADWLQKIDQLTRHATVYSPGSVALQLRPRLSSPQRDQSTGVQLAAALRHVLAAADPAQHLTIYASARNSWLHADAAWRLHVPEAQLSRATLKGVAAWSASIHSEAAAQRAQQAGAHMLVAAPVFPPDWKAAKPMGLTGLAEITAACDVPVLALGGMEPFRVAACLAAGAAGVAAASSIMLATDVATVMDAFAEALGIAEH